MMNVLVTGANGQLGRSIRQLSAMHRGLDFIFTDIDTLDLCNREAVLSFAETHPVDFIVNCAAYTAVDRAEEEEEQCRKINTDAVAYLGEAAQRIGARILHVSTDYVFDGNACQPYKESDPVAPTSVYGRTKLAGEKALLAVCPEAVIVRTAWLYSEYGHNFVKTMLRLGAERPEIRVVNDQVGTPTYAGDLASAVMEILESDLRGERKAGLYHYSDEGVCSWYDFAHEVIRLAGLPATVVPIPTREYLTAATRPAYSVLSKEKIKQAYGLQIPHWADSLRVCLANMGVINN